MRSYRILKEIRLEVEMIYGQLEHCSQDLKTVCLADTIEFTL